MSKQQKTLIITNWIFACLSLGAAIAIKAGVFFRHLEPEEQIVQVIFCVIFSVGFLIASIGIWRGKRWGFVLSALTLASFVIGTMQEGIQSMDFFAVFIRMLMVFVIITNHVKSWHRFKQYHPT